MQSPIKIIGTSHISKNSAKEVRAVFASFEPDIIAVELDKRRLQSLQERGDGKTERKIPLSLIKQVGVTGYLFLVVGGYLQKKLAGIVKVEPGVDMLAAVEVARQHEKQLALVDRDVFITMKRLSAQFTFKEKMRVVYDVLTWPLQRKKYDFPLDRVPSEEMIRKLMEMMKTRYPGLYKVLVSERNVAIATNVDRLARLNPGKKILLVVGAGHEEELRKMFEQSGLFLFE